MFKPLQVLYSSVCFLKVSVCDVFISDESPPGINSMNAVVLGISAAMLLLFFMDPIAFSEGI